MNIPPTIFTSGSGSVNGANTTTVTISCPANSLILTTCHTSNNTNSTPTSPSLTFTQLIANVSYSANGLQSFDRAFTTSALSGEVITFTATTNPQMTACVVVITNTDTTGSNGAGAIGDTDSVNSGGASSSSVTLTTTRRNSLVIGLFGETSNATRTAGTSNTTVVAATQQAFSSTLIIKYNRVDDTAPNNLTSSVTWGSSVACGGAAIEVKGPEFATMSINNLRPRAFAPGLAR